MFNNPILHPFFAALAIIVPIVGEAATTAEQTVALVEQTARDALLRQAEGNGLVEPEFEVAAVRIVARNEQIEVSMAGEALDPGARGALIRVRNTNGNIIKARVTGAGTVEPAELPLSIQSPR